jgi:hypothetical protein
LRTPTIYLKLWPLPPFPTQIFISFIFALFSP